MIQHLTPHAGRRLQPPDALDVATQDAKELRPVWMILWHDGQHFVGGHHRPTVAPTPLDGRMMLVALVVAVPPDAIRVLQAPGHIDNLPCRVVQVPAVAAMLIPAD